VVTVVGEVVALRERLRWFDNRPLFGRRVLVTRTRRQASALIDLLREEGAEPIELPAIEIRETAVQSAVDAAIDRLSGGAYAWVVFTSANGVEAFFHHVRRRGLDARAFNGSRVCVIGPGTAAALERYGLQADLVPEEFIAEAVVQVLAAQGVQGQAVLIPRAEGARTELLEGLVKAGAQVDEVPLYVAAPPAEADPEVVAMIRRGQVDAVTFASSSTVRNLLRLLGGDAAGLERAAVVCIGPVTADTARACGLRVDVVAVEHSVPGLVEALREYFARREGVEP
jgi:uroporphyrinogen III methyltransferase/synthase